MPPGGDVVFTITQELSKRFARAAASSRRSRSAQVFPSFAMPFDEFEEKLEEWTWNPRQERFMERYFVAAGISESCPGYDKRAQKAFLIAVSSCEEIKFRGTSLPLDGSQHGHAIAEK